jgi:AcrR family transcriptional regulator
MARPQAAEYEDRREAILEKAAKLYAKQGFLGASVSDLARACATSKSLIYHYFPSKEDILFEVMIEHVKSLSEIALETEALKIEPREKLRTLSRRFMKLYVGSAERHKVLLNELENLPPARRVQVVETQRNLLDLVESWLVAINPAIDNDRLRRPTTMLYFGMINWTHTWFNRKGPTSPDTVADLAAELMIDGLSRAELPAER